MTIILFVSMFSAIGLELDSLIEYVVIPMGGVYRNNKLDDSNGLIVAVHQA
ncbi:hypothetical protein midi_00328 [Candidatus Midichloria mitochondrii IricVA]|uniref:Uncharacterized protein n=2 Tax=Candidatus Midichloria mitochondrii TaxID=234827 RepID=F7XVD9_MIDMI|nr:hypothetical protein midi_00328 [Candidatus Midichloria mitochondrii IricVA]